MEKQMEQPEPYKTSDTPFAAYLLCNGQTLVTVIKDPNDIKRKVFVFAKDEDTDDIEDSYYKQGAPTEAHKYYKSVRLIYKELRNYND